MSGTRSLLPDTTPSCKWTGLSTAVPDFDDHAAAKAVKWAIQSAAGTDEPTLTLLLLPTHWHDRETTAYRDLLTRTHSNCVLMLDAPKELLRYQPPANKPFEQSCTLHKRSRLMPQGLGAQWETLTGGTESGTAKCSDGHPGRVCYAESML